MTTPLGVKIFLGVIIVAVVAVVVYGIYLSGPPLNQRAVRLDRQRVEDLRNISFALDSYWQINGTLPGSLEDLRGSTNYVRSISDPETGQPYEYQMLTEPGYEICAVFESGFSLNEEDGIRPQQRLQRPFSESIWDHGMGRVCFQKEAKPLPKPGVLEPPLREPSGR